jgi:hypothetical protein
MSSDRTFDALLRSWLDETAPSDQPQGLLESVVTATGHVRPRPAWLVDLRGDPMPATGHPGLNRFAPLALAATALIVALLIGIRVLMGPPNVGPSPLPGPTHSAGPEARSASWAATGSMVEARFAFTATRLLDGRVLVTGGDRGFDAVPRALASAELYDPATGTWTATGSMLTGRYRHTATLLPDGKVLVAGGNVSSNAQLGSRCCLATAELYDPATGMWTATGSMLDARVGSTATLLVDGKVLVAGGDNALVDGIPPGAELYDPSTGSWTATGTMGESYRHDHTATLLSDGLVLLVGGTTANAPIGLYDPRSNSWSATHCCVAGDGRIAPNETATLLAGDTVLVAGGAAETVEAEPGVFEWRGLTSSALLDTANGAWTATGDMIAVRSQFTATRLLDGTVLALGGHGGRNNRSPQGTAELYDPGTGRWIATASMRESRYGQQAVLLLDGTVLVVGGSSSLAEGDVVPLASAELYDPGSGS